MISQTELFKAMPQGIQVRVVAAEFEFSRAQRRLIDANDKALQWCAENIPGLADGGKHGS